MPASYTQQTGGDPGSGRWRAILILRHGVRYERHNRVGGTVSEEIEGRVIMLSRRHPGAMQE